MILRTNEKSIDLAWIRDECALMLLDEHADDEMLVVKNTDGRTLYVASFRVLKAQRAGTL